MLTLADCLVVEAAPAWSALGARRRGAVMGEQLKIIHLEDDPNDADLVQESLRAAGIEAEVHCVSSSADFERAIEERRADIVLSDYSLPQFDGLSALAMARRVIPETPFILVSGTLGEEAAVESLRGGATDYVLKTRLQRLPAAVRRAVEESQERARLRTTEQALERERRFLRALLDSLDSGVVACDENGILTLFNRATRELYGLPDEPLPPEKWATHYSLIRPDGKTPLPESELPLVRALHGEQFHSAEMTIARKDRSTRMVAASGQPIVDDHGTKLGAVIALRDVTEQRDLERQLRQSQRMEAMGRLAAGIAHDFNNLLTAINGFCALARARHNDDDATAQDLGEIARAGERAADLTRQLLAFSRQQVLAPQRLDLNSIVGDLEKMLKRLIGADIELVVRPGRGLDHIRADAGQMQQVLLNLVVNARDAMPQGGLITVETEMLEVDSSGMNLEISDPRARSPLSGPLSRTPGVPAGTYVTLTVTDTGSGMDPDTCSRAFEPFFTTKEQGRGTGLGLSTVHGIVTQSGGHVVVHSEIGCGARFRMYLPRVKAAAEPARLKHSAPTGGHETILVVDDDAVVLRLVTQILTIRGYTVLQAGSSPGMMALLEDPDCKIGALVTDVVMPGLSGLEVAERLVARRPNLPILFMSGHAGGNARQLDALIGPRVAFIQKPFTPEGLAGKLREVLDAPDAKAA
jgi:two-component system cell cycle sensor histidine kinase/response regulator CckA